MTNALISIQVIPSVPNEKDVYEYVDAAITVLEEAGVKYEVHPLETTMEGDMDELLIVVQKMNDRLIERGAGHVISQIKVLYKPSGIKAEALTEKYR
jgi:uncharacterized protein (TIGR00106 family)